MALPAGNLNLQQVVRDLEKRIAALEAELAGAKAALEAKPDEPAAETTGSAPEPSTAG